MLETGNPSWCVPPSPLVKVDKEALFWSSIKDSNNPESFRAYLEQFPQGIFARLALLKIEELKQLKPAVTTSVSPADRLEEISIQFEQYYLGIGVPHDLAKAFALAKEAAEMGDALGMFRLALLYDQGKGVTRDREEAGRWFLICIETEGKPILEALEPNEFSRSFWRVVQRKMREASLYSGRIDGKFGNATLRGLIKVMRLSDR